MFKGFAKSEPLLDINMNQRQNCMYNVHFTKKNSRYKTRQLTFNPEEKEPVFIIKVDIENVIWGENTQSDLKIHSQI